MKRLSISVITRFFPIIFITSCSTPNQGTVSQALITQRVNINPIQIDSSFGIVSKAKLEQAMVLLDSGFNSFEFATTVSKKTKFRIGNHGLSSNEILEIIKTGMNNYKNSSRDYRIDLKVKVFDEYFGHNNFGITNMDRRETRTHRCYILNNDVKCYAAHLAHEYMHQVGFEDKKTWLGIGTKTKSVPYKIGNIINDVIRNNSRCIAQKDTCTKTDEMLIER